MKDKFSIFIEVMSKEARVNHFGVYITVGQFADILGEVEKIYANEQFKRNITPMGDMGKNRL